MSRSVKWGLPLFGLIAVAAALGLSRSASATPVMLVDDDNAECPAATHTDIASAITDATEGQTILVCPGTYAQTTVTKRVNLVGYTQQLTKLANCSDAIGNPANQTTKNTIVGGFIVSANFVSIRGFTLDGADNGVLVPGSVNRTTVTRNVIQDNAIGINLNGTHNDADHNCLRDNTGPGSASGNGIYSDQGLKTTLIDQNVFFGNTSTAINLLDTPGAGSLDAVTVSKNVSSGDGDMISVSGSTHSKIAGNTSTGSIGSGIYLTAGVGPNSMLEISSNTLSNGGDEGIYADVASLTNSTVKSNKTRGNASFGIHIDTGNTGNSITNNDFKNAGAQNDCQDDSAPANTWKSDRGKTALPLGICKR